MLSNQDFAKFLGSGASEGSNNSEKKRFTLNEIAKLDKLNHYKPSSKYSSSSSSSYKVTDPSPPQENDIKEPKYRDRAAERRKKETSKEEEEVEILAGKVNKEYNQFLGGDMDHAHLVKGLDYSLLHKVDADLNILKKEKGKEEKEEEEKDYIPLTDLGKRIKALLFSSSFASSSSLKAKESSLSRQVYCFPIESLCEHLPTTIIKSKLDVNKAEEFIVSSLSSSLQSRLKEALSNGLKAKRKREEALPPEMGKKSLSGNINWVGDIFEGVGKYTPFEGMENNNSMGEEITTSTKELFSSLPLASSRIEEEKDEKEERIQVPSSSSSSAYLKTLHPALASLPLQKEKEEKEVVSEKEKGKGIIHRDIFGGEESFDPKKKAKVGMRMDNGFYEDDIFSLQRISTAEASDDEEEEDGGKEGKKKEKKEMSKGSGSGIKSTARSNHGENRAERRAAANKK